MNWILRLKHWQLFLMIIIPAAWTSPSPLKELVNVAGMLFFALWVYSIGICGYDKISESTDFRMNKTLFKINAIVSVISLLILLLLSTNEQSQSTSYTILIAGPLLLFLSCSLYIVYYASRILGIIEYNEQSNRTDFFAYFLGFCFLIVGAWFIQPKVNKIFAINNES